MLDRPSRCALSCRVPVVEERACERLETTTHPHADDRAWGQLDVQVSGACDYLGLRAGACTFNWPAVEPHPCRCRGGARPCRCRCGASDHAAVWGVSEALQRLACGAFVPASHCVNLCRERKDACRKDCPEEGLAARHGQGPELQHQADPQQGADDSQCGHGANANSVVGAQRPTLPLSDRSIRPCRCRIGASDHAAVGSEHPTMPLSDRSIRPCRCRIGASDHAAEWSFR